MPFPIDEKFIDEAEKELGITFPDSIRVSFSKMNGGEFNTNEVNWTFYPFFDQSDRKRISRTANHIVLETMEARSWHRFPQDSVSIGKDDLGNQIILRPKLFNKKKLKESIYLWHHENGKIKKVAKSINEIK